MPGPLDFSLDPTMEDVLPPAPTTLPQAPQAPPVVGQDPRQQLLNIAALGALLGAGPRSGFGVGAGQGLLQQQHGMQQLVDQHAAVVRQQQQQLAQAQQQQVEANVQRQRQLQSALMTITQRVQTLPDKDTYDQEIEGYANTLKAAGYRLDSNWLRQAVPYVAPTAEKQAGRMLEAFFKNPANAQMIKEHPDQLAKAAVSFDVDGDGIPENVPLLRLSQIAKMPFGVDEHGQMLNYSKGTTLDDKANADGIYQDLLVKAKADGKDVTNPDVTMPLREQAIKAAAGDRLKEKDPAVAAQQAATLELTRQRLSDLKQKGSGAGGVSDAEAIAGAIMDGLQPPDVKGLYRNAGPVRAALAREGYDLKTANMDWQAVQKHLATLNGQQQVRLRQATETAAESLSVIEDLAKQWAGGKFPILNRARLAAAKGGALGPQAQQIATKLEAQITDVSSELANVYMGGNSPTDQALRLASKNLSADWTQGQLLAAIDLARKNLKIRLNSMTVIGPAGISTGQQVPPAPTPAGAGQSIGRFQVTVTP